MTSADQLAIDLHDVAKTYQSRVHALRGVDMQVHGGEIFGLLGANGAGKSTLVKIMMTIVRPTRAKGMLLGKPIGHKSTMEYVGYMPEHASFPSYLKAREALGYYAALSKVPRARRKARIEKLLDMVGLANQSDARIGTFSKGMIQRIGLAQAMLNEPRLIVLDEPTDGVDPIGRREIRNVLLELKNQGKTVFLNSHLLGEVEMICDRVAILHQGLVVRQGRIGDLTRDHRYYEIELQVDRNMAGAAIGAALACTLSVGNGVFTVSRPAGAPLSPVLVGELPDGRRVELDGTCIRLAATDASDVQGVIDALRRASLTIQTIQPMRQSLEDYFIQAVAAQQGGNGGHWAGGEPPPFPIPADMPRQGGQA